MEHPPKSLSTEIPLDDPTPEGSNTAETIYLEYHPQMAAIMAHNGSSATTTQADVPSPDTIVGEPSPTTSISSISDMIPSYQPPESHFSEAMESIETKKSIETDNRPFQAPQTQAEIDQLRNEVNALKKLRKRVVDPVEAKAIDVRIARVKAAIKGTTPAWSVMEMYRDAEQSLEWRIKDGVDRLGIHHPDLEVRNEQWAELGW
ncbi:hypothetical protein K440DRAFT_638998 [Wilcoxina mikolae CBS 423.85]|nr:hypothetical protein K440DRAFT_638998 [Wilcoxina mikolae CBS 423.85]